MHESLKAIAVLAFMVAATVAAVFWLDSDPRASQAVKWISTGIAVGSLALFLKLTFRKDRAPDYLSRYANPYFNRGGFTFSIDIVANAGIAYLRVLYQNQFAGRCEGQVAIRAGQDFWMKRANIETICMDIDCGPGEFGMANMPLPISNKLQGQKQSFEVGASVRYPDGRGKQLRFADGLLLRTNSDFGNPFHSTLQAGYLLTGGIMLKRPAKVTTRLPSEVASEIPADVVGEVKVLWRLGDSPHIAI
ncbi:MAG: hypothetical protein KDA44_08390 [Planctomycetales bacterium]|nr:hypothetical protein [Planctomycetales bacterium]